MVNEITSGISKAIMNVFPECHVHIDKVEQELNAPCFFIALLDANQEQHLGRRLWREHSYDVHYFPENELAPNSELNSVADALRIAMRYINVLEDGGGASNQVKGTNMRHEIVDGVLHFFVSFNLFVFMPEVAGDYMETISHDLTAKP